MNHCKKARPTEYKGVVYRSKSEAMFARWIELRYGREMKWLQEDYGVDVVFGDWIWYAYEMPFPDVASAWRPDFTLVELLPGCISCLEPVGISQITLFEYKPSRPTLTHCNELGSRFHDAMMSLDDDIRTKVGIFELRIIWGSIWNKDRCSVYVDGNAGGTTDWVRSRHDWLAEYEDEVAATRFDLEVCEV